MKGEGPILATPLLPRLGLTNCKINLWLFKHFISNDSSATIFAIADTKFCDPSITLSIHVKSAVLKQSKLGFKQTITGLSINKSINEN